MRIVLTRETGHNEMLRQYLPDGADVTEVPLTYTRYRSVDEVEGELKRDPAFGTFQTLVVTSPRSEEYLEVVKSALSPDAQVFSVGRSTTRSLVRHDFSVSGESSGTAGDLQLVVTLGPVLLLGADVARPELPDALVKRGLRILHLACYETTPVELDESMRNSLTSADVVFIGAPSAWRAGQACIGQSAWVVVPGVTTADVVRAVHDRVIEGWDPSLRGILATLDD